MTASVHQRQSTELCPEEEVQRLAAVRRYDILDTPPDGSFDRITAIAARLFSVPISIISLVDHDRIWFKSHHGLDVEQIDRAPGLCASAILQADPWILPDAKADIRSLANPLVAGKFGLRFYAGVPLRTSDGFNLGTLCVIDREPRTVTEQQIAYLKDLASAVIDQMELRLSARRAISDLSRAIAQKDLMAKEIDHRVMNNLQLISSMLTLQSRGLDTPEAAEQLALAANRVSAIARVHQHIYLSEGIETTGCKAYLQRLCNDLSDILLPSNRAGLVIEAIDAEIPTKQTVALGLIVNELVTNSVKHGAGNITVSFERSASGAYSLSVSDDGMGLPAGFDPAKHNGLGLRVVRTLVQQLDGRLLAGKSEGRRGATFTVSFPEPTKAN
jgi:two-component sensor histidine kinase